jgi:hypothetical protein
LQLQRFDLLHLAGTISNRGETILEESPKFYELEQAHPRFPTGIGIAKSELQNNKQV